MILLYNTRISSIPCTHLRNLNLPFVVPSSRENNINTEINLLKSIGDQDFYDTLEIKVSGTKMPIEDGYIIDSSDDINKKEANKVLTEFLTILSFCLGYIVSSEEHLVTKYNSEFSYVAENPSEKKDIEEKPRGSLRQLAIGIWIVNASTTNEDIIRYWDLLDPISMFVNAEKVNSQILKIREFLRIYEYFNEKYKNDSRFPNKGKEERSREIIKKYTDKDISTKTIENWWKIDDKCSHGKKKYITSLDTEGLKEVNKAIQEIRRYARLLIEKISQTETRT